MSLYSDSGFPVNKGGGTSSRASDLSTDVDYFRCASASVENLQQQMGIGDMVVGPGGYVRDHYISPEKMVLNKAINA